MMKIKIIYALVFLVLVNIALAADVGVVVEFEDGSLFKKCITAGEGANGREILEKTGLDILWSPTTAYGSLICKINREGTDVSGNNCEYFGEFWNFNILVNSEWQHMPVGHDAPGGCWNRDISSWDGHYCGVNGDVIGYKFTDSGAPPMMVFDDICPETRIAISDLKVEVDGKDKNLKDGDTIKNVKPGSEVEFRLEVENLNKRSGLDINDVNIKITLDDIDLDEEADEFDLKSGSKKSKTLNFNVPLEVDEDSYDVIIEVEGEQEDGTDFILEWQLDLEIDKEKHSVVIENAGLENSYLECGESTNLNVKLVNLGSNDEETDLKVENPDLGVLIKEAIKLEEGEDRRESNK